MKDNQGRFTRKTEIQIYQHELMMKLNQLFQSEITQIEWPSMNEERDRSVYSPRIDVAVGPFATQQRYGYEYDRMMEKYRIDIFLRGLYEANRNNLELINDGFVDIPEYEDMIRMNHNARCFMAIEIEHLVSRKHLMGGAINATALGRLGVVIPWSDEKLRAFIRLVRYLHYLRYANKNTFNTSNLLIITRRQMEQAIQNSMTIDF